MSDAKEDVLKAVRNDLTTLLYAPGFDESVLERLLRRIVAAQEYLKVDSNLKEAADLKKWDQDLQKQVEEKEVQEKIKAMQTYDPDSLYVSSGRPLVSTAGTPMHGASVQLRHVEDPAIRAIGAEVEGKSIRELASESD